MCHNHQVFTKIIFINQDFVQQVIYQITYVWNVLISYLKDEDVVDNCLGSSPPSKPGADFSVIRRDTSNFLSVLVSGIVSSLNLNVNKYLK